MSNEESEATGVGEGGGESGGHVLVCELLKGGPRGRGAAQALCTLPLVLSRFSGNMGAMGWTGAGVGPRQEKQKCPLIIAFMHSLVCSFPVPQPPLAIMQSTPGPGPEPDVNRHLFVWTWGMTWGFASSPALLDEKTGSREAGRVVQVTQLVG